MELDPAEMSQPDRYKLLIGAVVPRPIALVSSRGPDGSLNLAPFSFFNGVGSAPMSLLFCPANKADGTEKDTLRNVTPGPDGVAREFVVNAASEAYERRVAAAAEPLAYGESEFELSGLTPAPSRVVGVPRVAESPVCFECRVLHIIRLAPGVAAGGNIVVGEVVHVYIRDDLVNERMHVDPVKLAAVGRMGGIGYCRTGDPSHRFEIPAGRDALR